MRLFASLLLSFAILKAQTAPAELLEAKLLARVRAMDAALGGLLGVAAIDLQTGRVLQYNGDTVFPQASSIKIPIMMQVYRAAHAGKLDLDAPVTLQKQESVGGSGYLRILLRSRPVTLSVRELVTAMIEVSDNTATNRLIAMVGMEAVNDLLAQLGCKHTRLQRRMLDAKAAAEDRENVSTPMEMARLAEALYRGRAVDAHASREMVGILKLVNADFRQTLPAHVPVAAKTRRVERSSRGDRYCVSGQTALRAQRDVYLPRQRRKSNSESSSDVL